MHQETGEYCFEDSVGFMIGRLRHAMAAELDEQLKGLDISMPQWVILMRIANGLGRTSAELCRCFSYDTGAMTRMLDRLEEKGLVRRERSTADRRIVELALTDAGRALYPELLEAGKRGGARLLTGVSSEEFELFKDLVHRMIANLEKRE